MSRMKLEPVAKPEIDPNLLNDPVFQRVLADSLAIQDRFSAEPVYRKTGKRLPEERRRLGADSIGDPARRRFLVSRVD